MFDTPDKRTISVLGLVIWGDLGDLTIYRARSGKVVTFTKTWPKCPPSPAQQQHRARWLLAIHDWGRLTNDQREQWKLAAARASLCATGYNAFIHFHMSPDAQSLATLARQTGTTLDFP
jgi:hypothetical protein